MPGRHIRFCESQDRANAYVVQPATCRKGRTPQQELPKPNSYILGRRYIRHFRKYGFHVIGINAGDTFRRTVRGQANFRWPAELAFGFNNSLSVTLTSLFTFVIRNIWNSRHEYLLGYFVK